MREQRVLGIYTRSHCVIRAFQCPKMKLGPVLDRELVASNLNRATSLIGSTKAVFTFLLFFFIPRFQRGSIDAILYQITLSVVVSTIFSFVFSGLCYYGIVGASKMSIARKRSNMKKGDTLFVLGLMLPASEPALILFTIGQTLVGGLVATLWVLFSIFVVRQS